MEATPTRTITTITTIVLVLAIALSACTSQIEVADEPEAAQSEALAPADETVETVETAARPLPDRRADVIGGMAARMRLADGTAIPGDLFQLMAIQGSTRTVRVYDETPFLHDHGVHPVTAKALDAATELAADIVGTPIAAVEMTTAAGGGDSAGLLYVLSHLQLATDGGLVGEMSLAATGALAREGRLTSIAAPDEKLAAAVVAGVDVVFTTTQPSADAIDAVDARWVATPRRARTGDVAVDRGWDAYRSWGAERSGLDVVGVRHVGDAIAYLCGTGSSVACELLDTVAALAETDEVATVAASNSPSAPAGVR